MAYLAFLGLRGDAEAVLVDEQVAVAVLEHPDLHPVPVPRWSPADHNHCEIKSISTTARAIRPRKTKMRKKRGEGLRLQEPAHGGLVGGESDLARLLQQQRQCRAPSPG